MFTEKALQKAKTDLFNITSNLAYKDYYNANFKPNGKRKSKKHIPYTLSDETEKALSLYKITCYDITEITTEQEEEIKGFLLPYRTIRTEYLIAR